MKNIIPVLAISLFCYCESLNASAACSTVPADSSTDTYTPLAELLTGTRNMLIEGSKGNLHQLFTGLIYLCATDNQNPALVVAINGGIGNYDIMSIVSTNNNDSIVVPASSPTLFNTLIDNTLAIKEESCLKLLCWFLKETEIGRQLCVINQEYLQETIKRAEQQNTNAAFAIQSLLIENRERSVASYTTNAATLHALIAYKNSLDTTADHMNEQ